MSSKTWGTSLCPILFFFALLLNGCLKQSAPFHHHTLSAAEQGSVSERAYPHTVLVGPVRVASILDRGQLVRQESAHSVRLSETHRWAGELREMLSDVLVTNLSRDLNSERIHPFPVNNVTEGLQVEIHFLHFEGDRTQHANVTARWKIISSVKQDILHSQTSTHRVKLQGDDYDELASGLSRGLTLLSREIADKLAGIQPPPST